MVNFVAEGSTLEPHYQYQAGTDWKLPLYWLHFIVPESVTQRSRVETHLCSHEL